MTVAKKPVPDCAVVTVAGPASELLLFAFGRQGHARVEITATDDATAAVLGARLGF